MVRNYMIQSISKTPLLILFILILLPTLVVDENSQIWALMNIVICTFFFLWEYSIVKRLVGKIKFEIKIAKFGRTLIATTIYTCFLSIYGALTYNKYDDPKWLLPIVIVGNFFLFFSMAYTIRFFAKTIAIADLERDVRLKDYLAYIIMIIFFPFGIWWLHPKIQSLIKP